MADDADFSDRFQTRCGSCFEQCCAFATCGCYSTTEAKLGDANTSGEARKPSMLWLAAGVLFGLLTIPTLYAVLLDKGQRGKGETCWVLAFAEVGVIA
eukprot:3248504-Rhodomonas_salina.2